MQQRKGADMGVGVLVAKWAPLLRLHPEELYFPMDPTDFIHASRFRHHIGRGRDEGYNKKTKDVGQGR